MSDTTQSVKAFNFASVPKETKEVDNLIQKGE